jgi:predicted transcriptional regulator
MITGEQVTQARELLRWSIVDLAHRSGVPRRAILMFEVEAQGLEEDEADKIKIAFEKAGVQIVEGETPKMRSDR